MNTFVKKMTVLAVVAVSASVHAAQHHSYSLFTPAQGDAVLEVVRPAAVGAAVGYVAEQQLAAFMAYWKKGGSSYFVPGALLTGAAALAGLWTVTHWDRSRIRDLSPNVSTATLAALTTLVYQWSKRPADEQDDVQEYYEASQKEDAAKPADAAPKK